MDATRVKWYSAYLEGVKVSDLSAIIKAYDVRGTVPDQLNEDVARAIGTAFARVLAERDANKGAVVLAHDMRESGPGLVAAYAEGIRAEGLDVINAGLCSTDELYYASDILDLPGAMFTASHNPAQYNGIKHCYAGAKPVGQDSGLDRVKAIAQELLDSGAQPGEPI